MGKKTWNFLGGFTAGILFALASTVVAPVLLMVVSPTTCIGCTRVGRILQHWENEYALSFVGWGAYSLLILYFIYWSWGQKNRGLRVVLVVLGGLLLYLPLFPILNVISGMLSLVFQNPPILRDRSTVFPGSMVLEARAGDIIREFREYSSRYGDGTCIREINPAMRIETVRAGGGCWRTLFLKKTGMLLENKRAFFPATLSMLEDDQIHTAFFSVLEPGVDIPPHVGYYKGYLRYHLGVEVPEATESGRPPFLVCGGETYTWKEGEGVVFDDTYVHSVKNPSNRRRVVLYLDVKRTSDVSWVQSLNDLGIGYIDHSPALRVFLNDR